MKYLLLLLLLLGGCSSVQQKIPVGTTLWNYRADMTIQTQTGYVMKGVGATQLLLTNPMKIWSPVAMDRLQITSCARQDVFQGVTSPYSYTYTPVSSEIDDACPIYFEAYSKNDLAAWAFLAFKDTAGLEATVECNGVVQHTQGMTVCQSKNGLEQTMTFKSKIAKFVAEPACHMTTADDLIFKAQPEKGFCRATFGGLDAQNKIQWHRAIFIGYDAVLLR